MVNDQPVIRPAGEKALVNAMFDVLHALRESHPEFYAELEDSDIDVANRAEFVSLMERAPNEFVRAYLFGKFTMREFYASLTGREFD